MRRAVDLRNVRKWLWPALLTNPILFGLAFVISRWSGADIPDPVVSPISALALFALFLPAAMLEEVGWSGFALDRLQARFSPVRAALLLGVFWALWHVPTLMQAGRALDWIAWWFLWTVSARLIMVRLYNWAGGSVMAVALYHALSNLCWQLYPISGSYFDPSISGLVTFAAAVIVFLFSRNIEPSDN
ncbi:MAG: CPBP family intramembrane glutamic endopeptidase [Hyphomonadaceae bacterium]